MRILSDLTAYNPASRAETAFRHYLLTRITRTRDEVSIDSQGHAHKDMTSQIPSFIRLSCSSNVSRSTEHAGLLTLDDFTLTFVSSRYPKDFLKMIRLTKDLQVEKNSPVPGIHQIYGERLAGLGPEWFDQSGRHVHVFPFPDRKCQAGCHQNVVPKYIDDPTNPYLEEMVDFKLNRVMTEQEMEVLAQVAAEVSTAEWERVSMFWRRVHWAVR